MVCRRDRSGGSARRWVDAFTGLHDADARSRPVQERTGTTTAGKQVREALVAPAGTAHLPHRLSLATQGSSEDRPHARPWTMTPEKAAFAARRYRGGACTARHFMQDQKADRGSICQHLDHDGTA